MCLSAGYTDMLTKRPEKHPGHPISILAYDIYIIVAQISKPQ